MSEAAFYSGKYRNVFREYGYSEEEINERLLDTWDKLFSDKHPETQIYFTVGDDEAYMLDTGNHDVRTEGMSYGMMMAVQLDNKEVFDRLWKWTYKNMYMTEGVRSEEHTSELQSRE